jgi:hypothetical protein
VGRLSVYRGRCGGGGVRSYLVWKFLLLGLSRALTSAVFPFCPALGKLLAAAVTKQVFSSLPLNKVLAVLELMHILQAVKYIDLRCYRGSSMRFLSSNFYHQSSPFGPSIYKLFYFCFVLAELFEFKNWSVCHCGELIFLGKFQGFNTGMALA